MKAKKTTTAPMAGRDFLRDLAALRARVDELAEQYCLAVKGRIDEIGHQLASNEAPGNARAAAEPARLMKLGEKVRKITLKPQKGRAKDLKRIQDLVDALNDALLGEG